MALASQATERSGFASRRSVAAAASAVAAMALAVAVAGRGCQVDENTPTGVVRSFAQATLADDRRGLYEHFSPRTRLWLDAAARRATDLVGGSKRFEPIDMIGIGQNADLAPIESIVVKKLDDSRAIVEVSTVAGERSELVVVLVDGQWLIELPGYSLRP